MRLHWWRISRQFFFLPVRRLLKFTWNARRSSLCITNRYGIYGIFSLHVTGQRTQDDETDSDLSDDWTVWRAVLVTKLSRNPSDSCRVVILRLFDVNIKLGSVCHFNMTNGFYVNPMGNITFSWKKKTVFFFLHVWRWENYSQFLSKRSMVALLRNKSRELF